MSSSVVSDAPSRDLAPIGAFATHTPLVAAVAVAGSLLALGAAGGASSAGSWPWAIAGFTLIAASIFVLDGVRSIPRSARRLVAALLALSIWTGLSALWSIDSSASLRELERDALYVAAFVAALGVIRLGGRTAVVTGVAVGATVLAGYALITFMAGRGRTGFEWSVPSAPIGYANAVAVLSLLGAIACLSLGAVAGTARARAVWFSLLAVLCPTIALTRSLGAILVAGVVAATGLLLWAGPTLRRHVRATILVGVLLAGTLAAAGASLGRTHLARNDRVAYWRVAASDLESHVAVGSGAGTYAAYWNRHPRPVYFAPFDAHSLYLETGAELGVVGLALLLAVLAMPLTSIVGLSLDPIRVGAASGFLAFILHAGIDRDWEVPVVTVAALYLASVLVGSDPRGPRDDRMIVVGEPASAASLPPPCRY